MMVNILSGNKVKDGIYDVHNAGLLVDARDFYMAFYKAAMKAERYIFIAGWLFDSEVEILRGDDAKQAEGPVSLLPFLSWLCERNTSLRIYILAWDFNVLYSFDREWLQEWLFNWHTSDRITFRFDSVHPVAASHHQKFVVIDGTVAFVGGIDFGQERWDTREHILKSEYRNNLKGVSYEPYHDMQCYLAGPVAERLSALFRERWEKAAKDTIIVPDRAGLSQFVPEGLVPMAGSRAAICRTVGRTITPPQENVREIREMMISAIEKAERLVYIENQYFSSEAVYQALLGRMKDPSRDRLNIILILPFDFHSSFEKLALGLVQYKMLASLEEVASRKGHKLGIYYRMSNPPGRDAVPVYIHSKLMIVDNAFITVGSANITNRSMGVDTELNVAFESEVNEGMALERSISAILASLLKEHTGVDIEKCAERNDIVERLDELSMDDSSTLMSHDLKEKAESIRFMHDLSPEDIDFDPEKPVVSEFLYEILADEKSIFNKGIAFLSDIKNMIMGQ